MIRRIQDCELCYMKCPQAAMAKEIAEGRMYATKEMIRLQKELEEYKQLEEQGLLLRLPCKVGDAIYVIPSKVNYKMNELFGGGINGVCVQTVDRIEYGKYGFLVSTCDGCQGHREENFGVTWFLTYEEADHALNILKEQNVFKSEQDRIVSTYRVDVVHAGCYLSNGGNDKYICHEYNGGCKHLEQCKEIREKEN